MNTEPPSGPDAGTPGFADLQYNPRLRVPDFEALFASNVARAAAARAQSPGLRELAYGAAPAETLDFFPAPQPGAPLLVFLHGGYWRALDKRDFSWIAPSFVAAGAAVAIVNYGLAPATPIEAIIQQVRHALRWLRGQGPALGIRGPLVCTGHSAGGHLVAAALARFPGEPPSHDDDLPDAGVAISGVFDLRPLVEAEFLGPALQLTAARAAALSPLLARPAARRPLLLAVGGEESAEFQRQSDALAAAWTDMELRGPLRLPARNHYTACDALADPQEDLFWQVCGLLGLSWRRPDPRLVTTRRSP